MRVTTVAYDLRAWRLRLRLTQSAAAELVGLSLAGYCQAEYRAEDRHRCNKTLALLCRVLEIEREWKATEARRAQFTIYEGGRK